MASMAITEAAAVLAVDPHATVEEIRRAHRRIAMAHHPDRHPTASLQERLGHTAAFRRANDAYRTLLAARTMPAADASDTDAPAGTDRRTATPEPGVAAARGRDPEPADRCGARIAAQVLLRWGIDTAVRELYPVQATDLARRVVATVTADAESRLEIGTAQDPLLVVLAAADALRTAARSWPSSGDDAAVYNRAFELARKADERICELANAAAVRVAPFPCAATPR